MKVLEVQLTAEVGNAEPGWGWLEQGAHSSRFPEQGASPFCSHGSRKACNWEGAQAGADTPHEVGCLAHHPHSLLTVHRKLKIVKQGNFSSGLNLLLSEKVQHLFISLCPY